MLQAFAAPAGLSHWLIGAVTIHLGAGRQVSRFPAMPHAMLTMRLARAPAGSGRDWHPLPPVTFHTLSTMPVAYPHAAQICAMGLLVRPQAAACLLGQACGAVVDQVLPWQVLAGDAEALRLDEAVHRAATDAQRLAAMAASFRRAMQAVSHGREQAHARLCAAVGRHGVLAADHLGLGRRQLERRCQAVLGVTPKQFQRLVRFRQALAMAVGGGGQPLSGVALDAGFYDQSHLAREARQLAGAPLASLLSQARPDSPWWPLASRIAPPAPACDRW